MRARTSPRNERRNVRSGEGPERDGKDSAQGRVAEAPEYKGSQDGEMISCDRVEMWAAPGRGVQQVGTAGGYGWPVQRSDMSLILAGLWIVQGGGATHGRTIFKVRCAENVSSIWDPLGRERDAFHSCLGSQLFPAINPTYHFFLKQII